MLVCDKKIIKRIKRIPIIIAWWWQIFYMWFLSNPLSLVNHMFHAISIKSSLLSESYVPIKWLPLVNPWSIWNYILTDIFVHFNCNISITISMDIASKGQWTTSQLMHWLQSVTSHHLNQWWAYTMMHIHASVDLSGYALQIDSSCSVPSHEGCWFKLLRKNNREIWIQYNCFINQNNTQTVDLK